MIAFVKVRRSSPIVFNARQHALLPMIKYELDSPVTREFCAECGTHILSKAPSLPGAVLIKVGTLDDPAVFGDPQMAIYLVDKLSHHHVPEGCAQFDRVPS